MRESLKLTVDPKVFNKVSEAAKTYGVTDVMTFFFRVKLGSEEGPELTDDEYKASWKPWGRVRRIPEEEGYPTLDRIDRRLTKP
jgi:hypothetical protein